MVDESVPEHHELPAGAGAHVAEPEVGQGGDARGADAGAGDALGAVGAGAAGGADAAAGAAGAAAGVGGAVARTKGVGGGRLPQPEFFFFKSSFFLNNLLIQWNFGKLQSRWVDSYYYYVPVVPEQFLPALPLEPVQVQVGHPGVTGEQQVGAATHDH